MTGLVRRLDLPPRILRYQARLASAAAAVMAVFLAGAGCWVFGAGSGPGLVHVGAIDTGGLVVMTAALSVARRAVGQVSRSAPDGPGAPGAPPR